MSSGVTLAYHTLTTVDRGLNIFEYIETLACRPVSDEAFSDMVRPNEPNEPFTQTRFGQGREVTVFTPTPLSNVFQVEANTNNPNILVLTQAISSVTDLDPLTSLVTLTQSLPKFATIDGHIIPWERMKLWSTRIVNEALDDEGEEFRDVLESLPHIQIYAQADTTKNIVVKTTLRFGPDSVLDDPAGRRAFTARMRR